MLIPLGNRCPVSPGASISSQLRINGDWVNPVPFMVHHTAGWPGCWITCYYPWLLDRRFLTFDLISGRWNLCLHWHLHFPSFFRYSFKLSSSFRCSLFSMEISAFSHFIRLFMLSKKEEMVSIFPAYLLGNLLQVGKHLFISLLSGFTNKLLHLFHLKRLPGYGSLEDPQLNPLMWKKLPGTALIPFFWPCKIKIWILLLFNVLLYSMSTKKKQTRQAALKQKSSQYDSAWKDVIEELLEPFLEFFFPVDLIYGWNFL